MENDAPSSVKRPCPPPRDMYIYRPIGPIRPRKSASNIVKPPTNIITVQGRKIEAFNEDGLFIMKDIQSSRDKSQAHKETAESDRGMVQTVQNVIHSIKPYSKVRHVTNMSDIRPIVQSTGVGRTCNILKKGRKIVVEEACRKDTSVAQTDRGRQSYLRNSHGPVHLIRRGPKDTPIAKSPEITIAPTIHTNNIANTTQNDLSIVGQALNMLGDEEMRNKALKALADCGIGLERLIPPKPPLNSLSIKESQTQTNVFGILDSNSSDFVRVTGDIDSIERLQEIKRQIIVDDTKISRKIEPKQWKFACQLDDMLNGCWVNKNRVEHVKQLLKVDPSVEKAYNQLERGFNYLYVYDNKGFLTIHNAVLKENENIVKMQIMLLRSGKESVDIQTEDGRTSLELAIKHSASSEIINLLLKSGASPAQGYNAHDSALTIAAKTSSPYLLQFIKYVTKSGHLNNVDTEGFTALHYCVINNNIADVKILIQANADVNVRDCKSGRTPLFYAFENEFMPIVKELLANGARPNIPNFSQQTVLQLYNEEKHYFLKNDIFI